jgi:predicted nucleotide-binding protein
VPYYHIQIRFKKPDTDYSFTENELDLSEEEARQFGEQYESGKVMFNGKWTSSRHIEEIEIKETLAKLKDFFPPIDASGVFYGTRADVKTVTRKFIKSPPKEVSEDKESTKKTFSKNIFIVHGNDHEPVKELKSILYEFGLNPIVLHEQASGGSSTVAEKLERYSKHVGYAFAILTPDDIGGQEAEMRKKLAANRQWIQKPLVVVPSSAIDALLNDFEPRARQNVIFEMGYFWGLLERKRVCCLLKGNVQKPSDTEGIVYMSFENSVEEVRLKIMKELEEAGYEIKF